MITLLHLLLKNKQRISFSTVNYKTTENLIHVAKHLEQFIKFTTATRALTAQRHHRFVRRGALCSFVL